MENQISLQQWSRKWESWLKPKPGPPSLLSSLWLLWSGDPYNWSAQKCSRMANRHHTSRTTGFVNTLSGCFTLYPRMTMMTWMTMMTMTNRRNQSGSSGVGLTHKREDTPILLPWSKWSYKDHHPKWASEGLLMSLGQVPVAKCRKGPKSSNWVAPSAEPPKFWPWQWRQSFLPVPQISTPKNEKGWNIWLVNFADKARKRDNPPWGSCTDQASNK